ncbi:major facilitator superfamily protein [Stylonychia lemnae]|uniref:Major facilitator superfamily protein n=1 Tax=Stylonychia lemnae TaxID=5949 RepID=A0A078B5U6_STYLE|nr:major facilitator superfamily protein [Stylonychia lemnae]|eukprot:CDW89596.1 major facilitator superfamily protein [Stylonychia lemnae]
MSTKSLKDSEFIKLKHVQQNQKNHYANFGKAVYCSVGFLILYTALNPTQISYTQILTSNNYDQLGNFCLALSYLFYGIGCLVASYIVENLGLKFSLSIAALSDTIWILSIIPPAYSSQNDTNNGMIITNTGFVYTTQILIQIIQGICLGLKWVAGGKYISQCATEETRGFYFGIFWGIFMISMVLGSLIAAFISIHFNQTTFLFIMATIATLSIVVFSTLAEPIPQERYLPAENENDYQSEEDDEIIKLQSCERIRLFKKCENYQAIEQKSDSCNEYNRSINQVFTIQRQSIKAAPISLKIEVKEILQLITSKRMLPLLPQLIWLGASIAIYSGILVIIIIETQSFGDDQQKFFQSMLTMVSFGAGEIMGSLISGLMIDYYGNKKTVYMNILLVSLQTCLMFVYMIDYKFSSFAFLLTFVWGLQDSSNNTLSVEILAFEFTNNSQSIAVSNFSLAMGALAFNFIQGFIKGKEQYLIYTTIIGFFGILCNISSLFFQFKPMPKDSKQSMKSMNYNDDCN